MEETLLSILTTTPIWLSIPVIIGMYFKDEIKDYVKWFLKKERINLNNHHFFSNINQYLYYSISNMSFHNNNPVRDDLVKDFVRIKMTCHVNVIWDFVNWDLEKINAKDLYIQFERTFVWAIDKSNQIVKDSWIPDIFVSKYMEVRATHRIELLTKVNDLCRSPLFPTNTGTMVRVLDELSSFFNTFMTDAEKTISIINWELDDLEYKGRRIGDWKKTNYLYDQ